MQAQLDQYLEAISDDASDHADLLQASYLEAERVMSPLGLENYLQGIGALSSLGKEQDLVLTYVQEMPVVVKAVGEDVVPDIIESIMKLSSLTSGPVLTLTLASMPLAAVRLGDAELLLGFLKLLQQLAAKAPRGLRPMLETLGELLSRLTLGGLRRWAMWGAEAYQRDFSGQSDYFAIATETSKTVLRRERRGTLFVDNHRKLNFYLRALWGRAFLMRPTSGDHETRQGDRPFIEDYLLHLPDAYDRYHDIEGIDVYRAAAAHAAAHIVYSKHAVDNAGLCAAQKCCIDLFEDARVEYLAGLRFPGLRRLWLRFFERGHADAEVKQQQAVEQMLRIGRALLDHDYRDDTRWIRNLADEFRQALQRDAEAMSLARDFGLRCHEYLSRHMTLPPAHVLQDLPLPYRDDNRYFRDYDEARVREYDFERLPWRQPTRRKLVSLMEMVNEIDSELEDGSPQEIWVLPTELFPYEDLGVSYNQAQGVDVLSQPFHYDEWDYRVQLARPQWTTVIERRQPKGDAALMDRILQKHKPVANRIRHLIDALQPRGVVRQRGFEDGDEMDLNAALDAVIDIRRGVMPDPRVNLRITHHRRDLSMVLLLDLSASTNDPVGPPVAADKASPEQPRVLDLTRDACGLLAWAVDSIGDNFAVHGFASDGRHDVQYYRFKDFDESYDDTVRARLAGMRGGLSTRMGAALRHAGRQLAQQSTRKRLVLLLTDGEPADIDERDPRYLREDCRHAVDELAGQGVQSFCLTLDAHADDYVSRIFGRNNYSIVDDIEALPERLPRVFSALTA
ncbi:MAG: VWA domain-containing protein [Gammaproteobacteria bacterium]|nr:VWA domain-containing protein [Gammaproteobacteria bacterium]